MEGQTMKTICAWCSRATDGNNDAYGKPIIGHSTHPNVSHGICNACRNDVRKERDVIMIPTSELKKKLPNLLAKITKIGIGYYAGTFAFKHYQHNMTADKFKSQVANALNKAGFSYSIVYTAKHYGTWRKDSYCIVNVRLT